MDDLLKQITGQSGTSGGSAAGPLGRLGDLLGGGGLGGGMGGALGGGLGAILPALLPSVLGMLGGGTGGVTGMQQILDGMHATGHGEKASSWVGNGENQPVSPSEVEQALGPDRVQQLSADSGLPPEHVTQGVAAVLPALVNHLTPDGHVPSAEALRQAVGGLLSNQTQP